MRAFDTAYPGSMHERQDGDYVRRDDAQSLAEALLEIIKKGERKLADERDASTADLKLLENDLKGLVIRLICEPEDSHSPETHEILGRWMPVVKKELGLTS